ncbi:MAG TPA: HupE/UreJ family protein [Thermoanaerobaculia bacterium]|nr:HupE/UreJ family protein [Thermoanaerobaculia bacterium]
MRRVVRAVRNVLPLISLFAGMPQAHGHELGAIRVQGSFERSGTYRFEISADTTHPVPATPDGEKARVREVRGIEAAKDPGVAAWLRAVAGAAVVSFDGRPAPSDISVTLPPADPNDPFATAPRPVLLFAGKIPPGARHASFRVDLPIGAFPVSFHNPGDGQAVYHWQEPGVESEPFKLASMEVPTTRGEVIRRYLGLGFTHILPKGLDHILFVLGLFLLSLRFRPLLAQVTAFTVAHTLSLALAMLGIVHLSPRIVEPLIAVSIVYVAIENVFARELKKSRVALVFAFGLLHGLGFAGVLSELGLPRSEFVPALLSFNVGVELGQLTVIAVAFLAVGAFRNRSWYKMRIAVPASLMIAAVGLYWAVTRALGLG